MQINSMGMSGMMKPPHPQEMDAEMKDFMKLIHDAAKSGDFNAEELAENAPDKLKALAAEKGVEVETIVTDIFNKVSEMENNMKSGKPPKMPPPGGGMQFPGGSVQISQMGQMANFISGLTEASKKWRRTGEVI